MKPAIITVWLIICAALCHGQDNQTKNNLKNKPDLSGTWELNKSKSKLTKANPVMKGGTITLTISHNEPEVRLISKTNLGGQEKTKEFLYYTDGRGEINPASNLYVSFYNGDENRNSPSPRTIKSKSEWQGDKLTTTYLVYVQIPDGRLTNIEVEDEWVISSDGKILTNTTSFSGRDMNFEIHITPHKLRKVFNKVL